MVSQRAPSAETALYVCCIPLGGKHRVAGRRAQIPVAKAKLQLAFDHMKNLVLIVMDQSSGGESP